jgi:hypothetical protein
MGALPTMTSVATTNGCTKAEQGQPAGELDSLVRLPRVQRFHRPRHLFEENPEAAAELSKLDLGVDQHRGNFGRCQAPTALLFADRIEAELLAARGHGAARG